MDKIEIGSKVYFPHYKRPFVVKACDERYAICTQPYNLKKTVLYTIIDFDKDIRGPNNLVFNMYDYTVQANIDECLRDLNDETTVVEVSRRNAVDLFILRIDNSQLLKP